MRLRAFHSSGILHDQNLVMTRQTSVRFPQFLRSAHGTWTNLLDLNTVTFELFVPRRVSVDVVHPVNQLDLQDRDGNAQLR